MVGSTSAPPAMADSPNYQTVSSSIGKLSIPTYETHSYRNNSVTVGNITS